MAIRDLLWACPLCGTPGGIRAVRRGFRREERCFGCDAAFRRGAGATIVAGSRKGGETRSAAEWVRAAGPIRVPAADAAGVILGPARVRVKQTTGQRPLRFGADLLGWVETYGPAEPGEATLTAEGLRFSPRDGGPAILWTLEAVTGVQPASAAIQIGLGSEMVAVRFVESSVRLWTRALTERLRGYYRDRGHDVVQFQPRLRTRARSTDLSTHAPARSGA